MFISSALCYQQVIVMKKRGTQSDHNKRLQLYKNTYFLIAMENLMRLAQFTRSHKFTMYALYFVFSIPSISCLKMVSTTTICNTLMGLIQFFVADNNKYISFSYEFLFILILQTLNTLHYPLHANCQDAFGMEYFTNRMSNAQQAALNY
jgi:hypothetical protein